jgi:hypothetical protein
MWESAPATCGAPADPGALNVLFGVGKADAVKLSDVELVETPRSGGRLDCIVDARNQSDNLQFIQCAQRHGVVSDLSDELLDRQTRTAVGEQQGKHCPFDSIPRSRSG